MIHWGCRGFWIDSSEKLSKPRGPCDRLQGGTKPSLAGQSDSNNSSHPSHPTELPHKRGLECSMCVSAPTLSSPNRAGERNGRLQRGSLPPQVWWWTKANVKHRQVLGSDVLVEPQSVFFSAKCPMHVWCSEELYPLHIHGHKRMPDLCLA